MVVALFAALGGGTLRDLLLDAPNFWIADQTYLLAAMTAGVLTFPGPLHGSAARRLRHSGCGRARVIRRARHGESIALNAPRLVASLMRLITGVFGDVLRDVFCNEEPLIFTGELYSTAVWSGTLLFVLLAWLGVDAWTASLAAIAFLFVVRVVAYRCKIGLPRFSSKA